MKYDTSEIRRAARQVGVAAEDLNSAATRDVANLISALPGNFVGEAATALNEELNDLKSDMLSLSRGLESVMNELLRYAARLDEADREASRWIEGKNPGGGGSADFCPPLPVIR